MKNAKEEFQNALNEFKDESASLRSLRSEKTNENSHNALKDEIKHINRRMNKLEQHFINQNQLLTQIY